MSEQIFMKYVVGFMFDEDRKKVLLIKKDKPEWQKGLLNGIGGKIESNEMPRQAMVREFREETGMSTDVDSWELFCMYSGRDFSIHFYRSFGDICEARSVTLEKVFQTLLSDLPYGVIHNLNFLIPMAQADYLYFPVIMMDKGGGAEE